MRLLSMGNRSINVRPRRLFRLPSRQLLHPSSQVLRCTCEIPMQRSVRGEAWLHGIDDNLVSRDVLRESMNEDHDEQFRYAIAIGCSTDTREGDVEGGYYGVSIAVVEGGEERGAGSDDGETAWLRTTGVGCCSQDRQ